MSKLILTLSFLLVSLATAEITSELNTDVFSKSILSSSADIDGSDNNGSSSDIDSSPLVFFLDNLELNELSSIAYSHLSHQLISNTAELFNIRAPPKHIV